MYQICRENLENPAPPSLKLHFIKIIILGELFRLEMNKF